MATYPADLLARAARIRLACFDVDGTLTNGDLTYDSDGRESKTFNVQDGLGLRLLEENGITVALITARESDAVKARVEKYIQFDTRRFQDVAPPAERGLLVTNLPYGDRIGSSEGGIRQLYEEVGDTLKQRLSGWQAVILAAAASPYKAIGLKPSRTIALMNGSIPCKLLFFELYAGSRRTNVC